MEMKQKLSEETADDAKLNAPSFGLKTVTEARKTQPCIIFCTAQRASGSLLASHRREEFRQGVSQLHPTRLEI